MRKTILSLFALMIASTMMAQSEAASEVMKTLRKANDYFMSKYADPTLPTNVTLYISLLRSCISKRLFTNKDCYDLPHARRVCNKTLRRMSAMPM